MFCTKCGQQLPNDAAFCSKCGNSVHSATSAELHFPTPKRPAGRWEYAEFTYYEDEPFSVANDKDGFTTLYYHLDHIKFSLELDHKRDGWQLAEEPDILTLMKENRFDMTIEPYGMFSRLSNSKIWTIRSTTLKFKRWVE